MTPSSVQAQDEPKATATTSVRINASSGVIRQHRPDRWSVLSVNAVNTGDEPRDGFVAAWFPPENGRQFARRLWVPGHALRYSWMPLKVPGDIPRNVERVDLTIASFDASSGREILQRRAGELMTNTVFAAIDHDASRTGTLLEKRMPDENFRVANVDANAVKTLVVARMSAGLSQRTADFEGDFLPPWSDVWQSLDEFMLTSDRILHDTAGLAALRGWVRDGGRLWI
ncbi:MAG TPA: hypothetical protein PLV92_19935, partial [Pirellulaceae bacterium]|nr:hypothetical protein [Pirellulaceae bacterium]